MVPSKRGAVAHVGARLAVAAASARATPRSILGDGEKGVPGVPPPRSGAGCPMRRRTPRRRRPRAPARRARLETMPRLEPVPSRARRPRHHRGDARGDARDRGSRSATRFSRRAADGGSRDDAHRPSRSVRPRATTFEGFGGRARRRGRGGALLGRNRAEGDARRRPGGRRHRDRVFFHPRRRQGHNNVEDEFGSVDTYARTWIRAMTMMTMTCYSRRPRCAR